jgi:hypothetical protein
MQIADELSHPGYCAEIARNAALGCPVCSILVFLECIRRSSVQPRRPWWRGIWGRRPRWWRLLGLAALAVALLAWLL